MQANSMQLEIINFTPERKLDDSINKVSEKLIESAPNDSVIKIVLRASRGVIRATCRVASHAGIFVAEAITESPIQALKQLEKRMNQQLNEWKKRRFKHK
jgi:ribosome-associated translation inhibitor RaiA